MKKILSNLITILTTSWFIVTFLAAMSIIFNFITWIVVIAILVFLMGCFVVALIFSLSDKDGESHD